MNENFINTIYLAIAFLLLFASAEVLYHWLKIKAELTRKYVHAITGLLTMLFPIMIDNHWLVLLLCSSFLCILAISLNFNLLKSINAVDRTTRGSILYPIVVYGCYFVFDHYDQLIYFYVPVLILAICDPIAALTGKRWPLGQYTTFGKNKTMSGSSGFFVSAFLICLVLMLVIFTAPISRALLISLAIALVTTIAEALTHKGYDNLTIPASALLVLVFFEEFI